MMNKQTILQAEHDVISDAYDWLTDKDVDGKEAIQYICGINDMAKKLLNLIEERTETNCTLQES